MCSHIVVNTKKQLPNRSLQVFLLCLEGSLRLVSGLTSLYSNFYSFGRLEVYTGGRWGTVCNNGFTITAANVACYQLGFSSASYFYNAE